jgi:hypothetical protein
MGRVVPIDEQCPSTFKLPPPAEPNKIKSDKPVDMFSLGLIDAFYCGGSDLIV